ncbi:MAG: hypothetical protein KBC81_00640 [Candidatus Pacebacteria bacterium]|nr:hypothetical protein [Candidatus Paceibacterota bacterium]
MNFLGNFLIRRVTPLVLIVLPFVLPYFKVQIDLSSFLTVVSLLFAILAGFFIAGATSNYLRLQELVSQEDAKVVSLYHLARKIDPIAGERMADAVELYTMKALDHELVDYAAYTEEELKGILEEIDKVEAHDETGFELIGILHEIKSDMFAIHQEMYLTTQTITGPHHWTILIALSGMTIFMLLELRVPGDLFISSLIAMLSYAIFQILSLIHDLDSNLFFAKKLGFKNAQQVFKGLNRPRYYPSYALENGFVKNPIKPYRVGKMDEVSAGVFKREITLVS